MGLGWMIAGDGETRWHNGGTGGFRTALFISRRFKAATPHFDVATNAALQKAIPALAHLASVIGDPAVRHRGTIGGSLANNDPTADYPAAVLALGATSGVHDSEPPADTLTSRTAVRWHMRAVCTPPPPVCGGRYCNS